MSGDLCVHLHLLAADAIVTQMPGQAQLLLGCQDTGQGVVCPGIASQQGRRTSAFNRKHEKVLVDGHIRF